MQKIKDAASVFLANKRVAVTGVSRHAKDHGSNVVYKRVRDRGCRQQGIAVIDGGCPCMFGPTADVGHKAMRVVFSLSGNVPKKV